MKSRVMEFVKISLLVTLLTGCLSAFQTENQDYLPLNKSELSKRFPVEYMGTASGRPGNTPGPQDKELPQKLDLGVSGAVVAQTDYAGLIISGEDKQGKPWTANLGDTAYASRFYVADFDHNGIRDVVLAFPTGGNGLAPSSHLIFLTFDQEGRPASFEADGYFDAKEDIFDLVDLDNDGRAELIYMNFDDGYWITNLYEATNARWQLIKGQHAGRAFPLYTRFTNSPNRKPVSPKPGRNPFAPDLSTVSPRLRGRLISYRWADISSSEDVVLTIASRQGKQVLSQPVSWYASFALVLDDQDGRRIISLSAGEEAVKAALNEIVQKKYEVALYGQRRADISSPEILWARPK